jgi:hypothetical protein
LSPEIRRVFCHPLDVPQRGGKIFELEQVEAKQRQAVRFAFDVLNDADKADELESLTPEEYAKRKGIRIVQANPKPHKETKRMAAAGPSKQALTDILDEVSAKVQDMLDAELTRKEIVILAKELDDIVNGPDEDEDDDDEEAEIDEDDDDE